MPKISERAQARERKIWRVPQKAFFRAVKRAHEVICVENPHLKMGATALRLPTATDRMAANTIVAAKQK